MSGQALRSLGRKPAQMNQDKRYVLEGLWAKSHRRWVSLCVALLFL
jgi:hypothetical protein